MKTTLLAMAAGALFVTATLPAQTTSFTYQGRLQHGGGPANGLYEMYFALFDAVTNGNPVGVPVAVAPVPVSNGLFTAALDFGAAAFMGTNRWLEISVTVFGSDQPVTTLIPRQPLTPTPYAMHAYNAGALMSPANAPLDIKIQGQRALRLEPAVRGNNRSFNLISGNPGNLVEPGVIGAVVLGGGNGDHPTNVVGADFSSVSGGSGHRIGAGADHSSIAGGNACRIEDYAYYSFIGGGHENVIGSGVIGGSLPGGIANSVGAGLGAIGGGVGNRIELEAGSATISGGDRNTIHMDAGSASIGGGAVNTIQMDGAYSVIAGGSGNLIGMGSLWATIGGGGDNTLAQSASHSTIAGGGANRIGNDSSAATIGGGARNWIGDFATNATIAGGLQNRATEVFATVGGGGDNVASGFGAVIAGGGGIQFDDGNEPRGNTASGDWSAVGGGADNVASGVFSMVGGGEFNRASGNYAVIAGGLDCEAAGQLSFAAGWGAKALHAGAFVWADHSPTINGQPFTSTTNHQFSVRAAGGVRLFTDTNATTGAALAPGSGSWSSLSDRAAKENFAVANVREILAKVAALPMASWNYKAQDKSVRHLGPMAQDFHAAFGLGENERTITAVDADGVALAAIQGLNGKLEESLQQKETEITELKRSVAELKELVGKLAAGQKESAR